MKKVPEHARPPSLPEGRDYFLNQWIGNAVAYLGAFAYTEDDALVFEQRKVLGNCGLGKAEALPDFFDSTFLGAQSRGYLEADGMTEGLQYFRFFVVFS